MWFRCLRSNGIFCLSLLKVFDSSVHAISYLIMNRSLSDAEKEEGRCSQQYQLLKYNFVHSLKTNALRLCILHAGTESSKTLMIRRSKVWYEFELADVSTCTAFKLRMQPTILRFST